MSTANILKHDYLIVSKNNKSLFTLVEDSYMDYRTGHNAIGLY